MNHQSQPSQVENIIMSALDPKSTMVYYLANCSIILLILTFLILYFILQSYHLLIMMLLALGLLGSVNYVWMHRIDPDEEESDKKKTSKSKTTTKRRKKKKKE